jgi:hypothetical protein
MVLPPAEVYAETIMCQQLSAVGVDAGIVLVLLVDAKDSTPDIPVRPKKMFASATSPVADSVPSVPVLMR